MILSLRVQIQTPLVTGIKLQWKKVVLRIPAKVTQVAEPSTHDPEIEGSNPATSHHQDKIPKEKNSFLNACWVTQVLEHSTANPKIEG